MSMLVDFIDQGWAAFSNVTTADDLLRLARSIGQPVPNNRGELISSLNIVPRNDARPRTLSANYGQASFPLHTDTAFWPLPAKFRVMRVEGDLRRTTTICPIDALIRDAGSDLKKLIETSVWIVKENRSSFYRKMKLRIRSESLGIRYDRQCMIPANDQAKQLDKFFENHASSSVVGQIEWSADTAVVISNWRTLHGRGSQPIDEARRTLQRIYVR